MSPYRCYNVLYIFLTETLYQTINSDLCVSNGMRSISNKSECETAARYLGLKDTSARETDSSLKPNGCVYALNNVDAGQLRDYLIWNTGGEDTHCGVTELDVEQHCICALGILGKRIYSILRNPFNKIQYKNSILSMH